MTQWYEGINEQEFTDAVNSKVIQILRDRFNNRDPMVDFKDLIRAHLCFWAESKIPAPENEIQSIQAWLKFSGTNTKEQMQTAMRQRLLLLAKEAQNVYNEGPDEEDRIGIYNKRPDLKSSRRESPDV